MGQNRSEEPSLTKKQLQWCRYCVLNVKCPPQAYVLEAWFPAHGDILEDGGNFRRWGSDWGSRLLGAHLKVLSGPWSFPYSLFLVCYEVTVFSFVCCHHHDNLPRHMGQVTMHWDLWNCEPNKCFFLSVFLLCVLSQWQVTNLLSL